MDKNEYIDIDARYVERIMTSDIWYFNSERVKNSYDWNKTAEWYKMDLGKRTLYWFFWEQWLLNVPNMDINAPAKAKRTTTVILN